MAARQEPALPAEEPEEGEETNFEQDVCDWLDSRAETLVSVAPR